MKIITVTKTAAGYDVTASWTEMDENGIVYCDESTTAPDLKWCVVALDALVNKALQETDLDLPDEVEAAFAAYHSPRGLTIE